MHNKKLPNWPLDIHKPNRPPLDPALTSKQWQQLEERGAKFVDVGETPMIAFAHEEDVEGRGVALSSRDSTVSACVASTVHGLIAIANASLSDNDRRKIHSMHVQVLYDAIDVLDESVGNDIGSAEMPTLMRIEVLTRLAEALESYLPPGNFRRPLLRHP